MLKAIATVFTALELRDDGSVCLLLFALLDILLIFLLLLFIPIRLLKTEIYAIWPTMRPFNFINQVFCSRLVRN